MIGTIRKHSSWLWFVIIGATIVSFVYWGAAPATRAGGQAGYGKVYGREVTPDDYSTARKDFFIQYWTRNHQWPDRGANMTDVQVQREIYWRLLLTRKAASLGIHVGDAEVVQAANNLLLSMGRNKEVVTMQEFVDQILTPAGLTAADLQHTLADDIAIQQVVQLEGISGSFVTPQEIADAYDHDFQQYSVEAVYFAATNYYSMVNVSDAAVQQFYTNYMAMYRQPDRVVVSYVFFGSSNYLSQAAMEVGTNVDAEANSYYENHEADFTEFKTPAEAKAKIREEIIHQRAAIDAKKKATDFASPLFAMDPAKAENLGIMARQQGLPVKTTSAFSAEDGPMELNVPAQFAKIALGLNADSPYAGPIEAPDGYYIIALAATLPSNIPTYTQISRRVTEDYRNEQALALAQRVGTNFYYQASVEMAAGTTFAKAAASQGYRPITLPAFSLATQDLAEFTTRELDGIKQAALSTAPGHLSSFVPLTTGGLILYVKGTLPTDATKKAADLPQFAERIRRDRINDVFNVWLQTESEREFRNIAAFQTPATDLGK